MTEFSAISGELEFSAGQVPAIAITLNSKELEGYKKETKKNKAKREEKKVWKDFKNLLQKENLKKGYEIIEGLTPQTFEGEDREDTIINSGEEYVVILQHSIPFVSGLPEKVRKTLSCGVRWVHKSGEIYLVPIDNGEILSSEVEVATDWDSALEQFDVAREGLIKLEEELNREALEKKQSDRNKSKKKQKVEKQQDHKKSEQSDSSKEVLPNKEEPVVVNQANVVEKPKQNTRKSRVEGNRTETYEQEIISKVDEMFPEFRLDEISNIMPQNFAGEFSNQVSPVVKLITSKVNTRVKTANKDAMVNRNSYISTLNSRVHSLLTAELERIDDSTNVKKNNGFKSALKELEAEYKSLQGQVEAIIQDKHKQMQSEYEQAKKKFIEEQIDLLKIQFDKENKPTLEQRKDQFKIEEIAHINKQYQEGIEEIQEQARLEAEKAKNSIVPRILSLMEKDFEEAASNYRKSTEKLIKQIDSLNSKDIDEANAELRQIIDRLGIHESREIEKISTNMEDLSIQNDELKNELQSIKLNYETKEKESKYLREKLDETAERERKLEETNDTLRTQLDQMAESKASLAIYNHRAQQGIIPIIPEQPEKRQSDKILIGAGIIGVAIVIAVVLGSWISSPRTNSSSDDNVAEATTQMFNQQSFDSTEPVNSGDSSTSPSSAIYEAKEDTTKKTLKVNDEITARLGDKLIKAKVTQINESSALVKTEDGQVYTIALD